MRKKCNFGRKIEPDAKYNNVLVAKIINKVMQHGKKRVACKIVYDALDAVMNTLGITIDTLFGKVFENTSPKRYTTRIKLGGAIVNIPRETDPLKRKDMAITFIVSTARGLVRSRDNKMCLALSNTLKDCYNGNGESVKKKEELEKLAAANAAFAHFASSRKVGVKKDVSMQ